MRKVVIAGAGGYIGSVLAPYLAERGLDVLAYDTGFFEDSLLSEYRGPAVVRKDMRDAVQGDFAGADAVVMLAGISNDALGGLSAETVYAPTRDYAVKVARYCKTLGAKFIYASSCSIYGRGGAALAHEGSEVFPQTPYSLNKLEVEQELAKLADRDFAPISLRFATVFGPSPRIRFDVFVNMFAGMALTSKRLVLNSDGSAWRPSLHILDACKAVHACLGLRTHASGHLVLNVGEDSENYQIRTVAELVRDRVPGCRIEFLGQSKDGLSSQFAELVKDRKVSDGVDTRSYQISFAKIKRAIPGFRCDWSVPKGIDNLIDELERAGLDEEKFLNPKFYRLQALELLHRNGRINDRLRWAAEAA
ncbi:MAG: NAD-dependent epimerase/dehydratase family protein [Elusimicrobia bacterium]|nr:NAD-dependent epimerase/dehydratase family protein [Elusimicrobiota bacterium]